MRLLLQCLALAAVLTQQLPPLPDSQGINVARMAERPEQAASSYG